MILFFVPAFAAESPCDKAKAAWKDVTAYRGTYRAITSHEGKVKETIMVYTFQKPGKIRMDIQKPRKGAVLLYNPEVSPKVRIRPFPKLSSLVLDYDLTHKRVSSDAGGTIDKSDLGHKIDDVCGGPDDKKKRLTFGGPNGLLNKVEFLDDKGQVKGLIEINGLEIDPALGKTAFTDF